MRLLAVVYVVAAVAVTAGVSVGLLRGDRPDPVLLVALVLAVVAMLALAVAFLGRTRVLPVVLALIAATWLTFAVTCLVAPGVIADPQSTRGPTTDAGARVFGVVMLVPGVVLVLVPWTLALVRKR